ncbi:Zinc finger MYMtype protein 1like [Caligus rogercresseyi]|uniref:Zinc finger MYMtype protein 1like n=1 Tax=Caligus rogercresseyi TaxID=217165 RepID=A0A7T8KCY6_CALRO|nr:Zinc finger MYMtype protein 1like [Caligus rogercresseyi]
MNVDADLQQKRLRSTERHFSYAASDEPLSDALKKLELTFFNFVVDAATSAIR